MAELEQSDGTSAQALFEAGLAASQDRPRRQRLLDRAIVQAERETGSLLALDLPHAQFSLHGFSFCPDGRVIALAEGEEVSILERRVAFRETHRLGKFAGPVVALAFSPSGKVLAAGSQDNTVRLWDTTTWTELKRLTHVPNQREIPADLLDDVEFSPDGSMLVTATTDGGFGGNLRLWDVAKGTELRELEGARAGSSPVSFAPDGKSLSASSYQEGVHTWDVATGARIAPSEREAQSSMSVGDLVQRWRGSKLSVSMEILSADRKKAAIVLNSATDQSVHLLDVASAQEVVIPGAATQPKPAEMEFSPDSSVLAIQWYQGIAVVEASSGKVLRAVRPASDEGHSHDLSLSLDGAQLATGSTDRRVHLWTLEPKTAIRNLGSHESTVQSVALSADGKTLVSCSSGGVVVWSTTTGEVTRSLPILGAGSVAFSRDGKLAAGVRGSVELWDVSSGERTRTLPTDGKTDVRQVAFSPDGKVVSGSTGGGDLYSWTVATGVESPRAKGVRFVYSPNGSMIAAGVGEAINLLDGKTSKLTGTLTGHTQAPGALMFSPDGTTLITGSRDDTVRFWDVATLSQSRTVALGHAVDGLAYLPNRRSLWVSSEGLALWTTDAKPLIELRSLAENSAGYAIASGDTPYVEVVGPLVELAASALQCRIGPLIFPFELCRERLEVPGMVQKAIAGDGSFADP